MPTNDVIWKYASEEVWFYHQFKRIPTPGWLSEGEVISSVTSIEIFDEANHACPSMLLDSNVNEQTRVAYKLGGGTAGETYTIHIKILTSQAQKFEDHVSLEVY